MLKTDKVIVVEGKYDAIKLHNIIDASIFITEGFSVFNDREKLDLLKRLAEKRGLVILTDPDSAGFLIRNYIKGAVPKEQITNVYIEDIYGKEKRKTKASKEGKLGVEGVPDKVIIEALLRAGVGTEDPKPTAYRQITSVDFYNDGLLGRENSRQKRLELQKRLGLPERLTSKQLLDVINMVSTYAEYKALTVDFPAPVSKAFDILKNAGYEAYAVGGCTRDIILGMSPHDWDITTSAEPDEILKAFEGYKTYDVGLKHGTVSVNIDGDVLEITAYRIETGYADGRHPDSVKFTRNLEDDLKRRDFTMNAVAFNPECGYVDKFNGLSDIDSRIIRCVGSSNDRFEEDSLRILRALRFSSVLGFSIEAETSKAIHEKAELIKRVSAERITSELLKLLCGDNAADVLLEYSDVFKIIIPQLESIIGLDQHNIHHIYDVYEHSVRAVEAIEPEPALRLAALLHDIGKGQTFSMDENGTGHFYSHDKAGAEIAEEITHNLKLSKEMSDEVVTIVRYHHIPVDTSKKILNRRVAKFGENTFRALLKMKRADAMASAPDCRNTENIDAVECALDKFLAEPQCVNTNQLDISGKDLIKLGMSPSPEMGRILKELLSEVMDGRLENEKEALTERAKELI